MAKRCNVTRNFPGHSQYCSHQLQFQIGKLNSGMEIGKKELGEGKWSVLRSTCWHSYLLRVVLLVREERRNMEHDFNPSPVGVNRVESRQVVNSIQSSFVLIESCSNHYSSQYQRMDKRVRFPQPIIADDWYGWIRNRISKQEWC